MRTLQANGDQPVGVDLKSSEFTRFTGNIADRSFVRNCIKGCEAVIHTATLHKPHVGTHSRQDFVDTNISGTLNLLEESLEAGCTAFVYTSTTSTFGNAMQADDGDPAVWVTEKLHPKPRNIYGVTKVAAEDLCELFQRRAGLPCVVLRTSRFFPEEDDAKDKRDAYDDTNLKVNELLFRRVDISDVVDAHRLALSKAARLGFDRLIISATTPFNKADAHQLGSNAPTVLEHYVPEYAELYTRKQWKMFPSIGRVYDNSRARELLDWTPHYTFARSIKAINRGDDYRSEMTHLIGSKGYHSRTFDDGPYPVSGF